MKNDNSAESEAQPKPNPKLDSLHNILSNKDLIQPGMDQSIIDQINTTIKNYLELPVTNQSKLRKLKRILKKAGISIPALTNHKPSPPVANAVISKSNKFPLAYIQRNAHKMFASINLQKIYLPLQQTSSYLFVKLRDGLSSSDHLRKNERKKDDDFMD